MDYRVFTTTLLFGIACLKLSMEQGRRGRPDPQLSPLSNAPRRTSYGDIQGGLLRTENGNTAEVFLGIPFANPPVGRLRFRTPEPPTPWNMGQSSRFSRGGSVLNATRYRDDCTGLTLYNDNGFPQSEDCLYLNIYKPQTLGGGYLERYPVMVWIHGGGWFGGMATDSKPEAIVDSLISRDVIVILISYRTNAYGFFSTGGPDSPGNYAFHDQIMALRWIQNEIGSFDGDPGRVTIFGQSTGSMSVSMLSISPRARGLFQQGILMGEAFGTEWPTLNPNRRNMEASKQLAIIARCATEESWNSGMQFPTIVQCMQRLSPERLKAAADERQGTSPISGGDDPILNTVAYTQNPTWWPIENDGPNGIFPGEMRELAKQRAPVPMIIGTGKDEWTAMSLFFPYFGSGNVPDDVGSMSYITEQMIPALVEEENFNNPSAVKDALAFEYGLSVPLQDVPYFWNLQTALMMSDFQMYGPITRDIQDFLGVGSTVYVYSLNHLSKNDPLARLGFDLVPHMWDIQYVFGSHNIMIENMVTPRLGGPMQYTTEDNFVMDLMQTAFTSFAKSGVPATPPQVQWVPTPPGSPITNVTYLAISYPRPSMQPSYHPRAAAFWNSLVPSLEAAGGSCPLNFPFDTLPNRAG